MRLDIFLKTVGIVKRRPEAARLIRGGFVFVDDQPAKAAVRVRPGQRIRVETSRSVRVYEVLELPAGRSVSKSEYARYARLVESSERPRP
jgi:ribosomal 50S subunit-recycling heat shock protein